MVDDRFSEYRIEPPRMAIDDIEIVTRVGYIQTESGKKKNALYFYEFVCIYIDSENVLHVSVTSEQFIFCANKIFI